MTTPSVLTTQWYKTKYFWLAFIFVCYSIFGWFGVPAIVHHQLSSVLKKTANWDIDIQNIVFNPYALSLELSQANFKNSEQVSVVAFKRFYINFSAISSLTGTISFDEISLEQPVIHLNIDEQGQTNFQHDFASDSKNEIEQQSSDAEIIPLFLGLLAITDGQLHLEDHSQGETFNISFKPLSLHLNDFSTQHNEGGEYSLAISLGDQQEISWKGQIGIAPFQSKGHLALSNIKSASFWHYVKKHSPYWLNNADISLAGNYDTQINNDKIELNIDSAQLSINNIALATNEHGPDFLQLPSLDVGPIQFNLAEQALSLGNIHLDTLSIDAIRQLDKSINFLTPLSQKEDAKPEIAQNNSEKSLFKWDIASIQISKAAVHWQDQSLQTPANLNLDNIELKLSTLSHDLSKAFPYKLSLSTDGANHHLEGTMSPQPFVIDGSLNINAFPLNWAQNYLSESANIILNNGTANIESQYQLSLTEQLQGKITTHIQIDKLDITDGILSKPLSGFEQFTLSPIVITLGEKTSINVESIRLIKPYGDIFIAKNGTMNLAALSTAPNENKPTETSPDQTAQKNRQENQQTTAPQINIAKFEIKDGRFEFTDASQTPSVNSYFDQVSGSIKNLSSDINAQSTVDIQGNLDTYGKLSINGTLNPLSQKPNTDLSIQVSNIDLTTASPYSAKFAGYLIDKGKLDLKLNYKINGNKLNAKNHIFIDQFEFGDSVDSPDATSLPLPLAIGIMKNFKGEIDIDLPISGDLDDPSFSISSIAITAFTNLITKVVTSPFSILGALVEGSDDISSVSFLAGSSNLEQNQETNILKLATALKDRPKLNLEIRGIADASIDSNTKNTLTDEQLKRLAKDRALTMASIVIDQGNINKARIFILEPSIIRSEITKETTKNQIVPSNFTLSVK